MGDNRKAPIPPNTELVTPVKKIENVHTTHRCPSKLDLKKKIKVLHQKVRRRDKKIQNLNSLVNDLLEKKLISEDVSKILEENFSGLPLDIIQNHFKNKDWNSRGQRQSDEVKGFALTLNFYSPKLLLPNSTAFVVIGKLGEFCKMRTWIDEGRFWRDSR